MNENKKRVFYYGTSMAAVILLIVLDQWTKLFAIEHLKNQPAIPIVEGVFSLHYLENRGAAFGLLQNQFWLFAVMFVLILSVIVFFYIRLPFTKRILPLRICGLLIVAGGIGNMIDRGFRRYVVDFLYFELIDFPIFNVADIYVTVAVVVLIVLILFVYKDEELDLMFRLKK